MSEPMPTPWRVNRCYFGSFVEDANGRQLFYAFDDEALHQHLPRLVAAVNAHDALLAACVEALAALDDDSGTCRRLRAAIAAAKGSTQ